MEAQYAYHMNYLANQKQEPLPLFPPQKQEPLPLFPPKASLQRPQSEATEFFEEDDYPGYSESMVSLGTGSISTASTPDTVTTPNSTGLTVFDFHIDDRDFRGPSGPHLFGSLAGSDVQSTSDIASLPSQTPLSTTGPYHHKASKFEPFRRDTPVPNRSTGPTPEPQQRQYPQSSRQSAYSTRETLPGRIAPQDWTPSDVARWLQYHGFDTEIWETMLENDISGSILLELSLNDIKNDIGIKSFGKRHRLMGCIQNLKNSSAYTTTDTASSRSRNSSISSGVPSTRNTSVMSANSYHSCSTSNADAVKANPRTRRQNSDGNVGKESDLVPSDSVSIVAIEQLLPKLHQCSKGEACRKWQKQQDRLARLARDLPFENFGSGRIVAGDPGNPQTAPNLFQSARSEATPPSLVASSDIMGSAKPSAYQLSRETLNEVKPRDPQENVRNFLNFQSLDRLQTSNQPGTPPLGDASSSELDPYDSAKVTPTLADNLRHLPKLRIPSMHDSSDGSVFTENISALRTITPSVMSRRHHFNDYSAVTSRQTSVAHDVTASPGDFYRNDPCYRSETPFSDADAPITAVPIGPVAREESQSVPPNMRFGNNRHVMQEAITRPTSTRMAEPHWRQPPIQGAVTMEPPKETHVMSPIETPEDLHKTPRAPQVRNNVLSPFIRRGQDDVTHSGWMKKRKTTKLLRHDWEDHHFTLKGTQLSMRDDDLDHHNSKALEYIDVDDYAVACSSFTTKSKLTAAFRKTVLKHNQDPRDVSAFSFSLIPTSNGSGFVDRKTKFLNSGKSHHFAVKTRDERIDWMRELMLAKALKRGRDAGAELTFNGANMI
ncbi:Sterile alpha motif type 2 [Penicillium bovifimosum]|uniref:Sterile alpha motif type 2 n=1 Tax=Penicillium bovifimosum TaxID=126998 RepID=A0A9W9GV00_9EURO|nr:Sterile alpha motif type 2 [Penicillium bovifimosum]KAJ5129851.1 Sterile alpha motif type 2 [Penicillium bovifimosum]